MYKVYVKTDGAGRITAVNSDAFLPDTDGWTLIGEGEGDRYHHAQGNYLPGPLMTDEGVPRYKLVGGEAVERTAAEIAADIAAIPPPPPDPLQVTQKAATVMFRALAQTDVIKAEDALDNAGMFPVWAVGLAVIKNSYYQHGEGLYRAVQSHTTQDDWKPDTTPSLWTMVNKQGEIPAWSPGSWDLGAIVTHNGGVWESKVPNNTYEPGGEGVHDFIWLRLRDT